VAKPNKPTSVPQIEVVDDEYEYEIQSQWPDQPQILARSSASSADNTDPTTVAPTQPATPPPTTTVPLDILSRVCNTPFTSPESAIEFIRSLCVLSVNNITITIDPNPWERFMSRNVGAIPAEQYAQEQIGELINEWVGW